MSIGPWWADRERELITDSEVEEICNLPAPDKLTLAREIVATALRMGGITPLEGFVLETAIMDAAGEDWETYYLPHDARYFEAARRFGWGKEYARP